jgi:hypothetical protein
VLFIATDFKVYLECDIRKVEDQEKLDLNQLLFYNADVNFLDEKKSTVKRNSEN